MVELAPCPECPASFETPNGVIKHRVLKHGYTSAHGTESKYAGAPGRKGCRCEPCREARRRRRQNLAVPMSGSRWARGKKSIDRDIVRQCEDRDDPADARRDDVAILHLGASKALCARTSGVMEAMIRGLSESR